MENTRHSKHPLSYSLSLREVVLKNFIQNLWLLSVEGFVQLKPFFHYRKRNLRFFSVKNSSPRKTSSPEIWVGSEVVGKGKGNHGEKNIIFSRCLCFFLFDEYSLFGIPVFDELDFHLDSSNLAPLSYFIFVAVLIVPFWGETEAMGTL